MVAIHATSPGLGSLTEADLSGGAATGNALFWLLAFANQAARFSVPAFFLMAGFFTTYHAAGRFQSPSGRGAYIKQRLARLLFPYLTWSIVFFLLPWWLHGRGDVAGTLEGLALGRTFTGGYYLIALAQISLLAPWLVRGAERFGSRTAWAACLVSLAAVGVYYRLCARGSGALADGLRDSFSLSLSFFPVWIPFFAVGLLLGLEAEARLPRLARARRLWAAAAAALYVLSLFEFTSVWNATRSLGLAASFLKPASAAFALAVCAAVLGGAPREGSPSSDGRPLDDARPPRAVRLVADASYAIYLVHGGLITRLGAIACPAWRALLAGAAGPLVLAAAGLAVPLALHGLAARYLPRPLRTAIFG